MFNDQAYEDAVSIFRNDLEDVADESEPDDINSFLNSLGIRGNIDSDDEDDEDDGKCTFYIALGFLANSG